MPKKYPARLHLLPAKRAPVVVILRRKPSKCFHVMRYFSDCDRIEHGSWFTGVLYPMRCDVSFDGQWMVCLAMEKSVRTWNGVCALPWLKPSLEGENVGTWFGGGIWSDENTLLLSGWEAESGTVPFSLGRLSSPYFDSDLHVLYPRLKRDGWLRAGGNWGKRVRRAKAKKHIVDCVDDDGWIIRPSTGHPVLRMKYVGYLEHGHSFRFSLDEYPHIVDESTQWACYDCRGHLVLATSGRLRRYSIEDLQNGVPGFELDLNEIEEGDVE